MVGGREARSTARRLRWTLRGDGKPVRAPMGGRGRETKHPAPLSATTSIPDSKSERERPRAKGARPTL